MKLSFTGVLVAGVLLVASSMPGAALAGSVLDRIVADKTLRLGVRTDAPPFSSISDGVVSGFSVDLCRMMAGAITSTSGLSELTFFFVEVSAEDRFDKLASGEIDVLCGATTASLKRRETMSFSIPIFSTGVGAVVNAGAPDLLKEVLVSGDPRALTGDKVAEAFKGRAVGVRAGTTAETWLKASPLAKIEGLTIATAKDHRAGVGAVAHGTLDAYFADQAILIGQRAEAETPEKVLLSRLTFTNEPYALAMPRDDEDLRLIIDRALSYLYRTGNIYKVFEKHFGKPSPEVVLFYSAVTLPE